MPIFIRRPKPKDLKDIHGLLRSVSEEGIWTFTRKIGFSERRAWFADFLKKMRSGSAYMLVAEIDGKVVGNIVAIRQPGLRKHCWDMGYQVLGRYRNRGVCTSLFEALYEERKKIGAEILFAWVVEWNKISIASLKKFGFKQSGRIKNGAKRNGRYFDYILFTRKL